MRYLPLVLTVLLLCMCLLPQGVFLASYGRLPLYVSTSFLNEGMTKEEVLERLGPPHSKHDSPNGETWYYWNDCLTVTGTGIKFTPEGKISFTWI